MAGFKFNAERKHLPMFFLVDVSGSMYGDDGEKLAALNGAMKRVVIELKKFVDNYSLIDFSVRVITFGYSTAQWKTGSKNSGILLKNYDWVDIQEYEVNGGTPTDKAIELLKTTMGEDYREYLGTYVGTPLIMLISDGQSNDKIAFKQAVDDFEQSYIGPMCIRVAIGINTMDDTIATEELQYFGKNGFKHCTDSVEELSNTIVTATLRTLKVASDKTKSDSKDACGNIFNNDDTF